MKRVFNKEKQEKKKNMCREYLWSYIIEMVEEGG